MQWIKLTTRHTTNILYRVVKWREVNVEQWHCTLRCWRRLNDPFYSLHAVTLLQTMEWSFCCIHHSSDSQCFSVAPNNPQKLPFRVTNIQTDHTRCNSCSNRLTARHSGTTSVCDRQTFPVLRSTCRRVNRPLQGQLAN